MKKAVKKEALVKSDSPDDESARQTQKSSNTLLFKESPDDFQKKKID